MKIGVVYPQTEYSSDPQAVIDYAQTVEELGYTHVLAYDHVLGANPDRPGGWNGPYTYKHPFMEPFILFSFMAPVTRNLEFATGVIILPQRQTALAAKQAATLDVLCSGRLRLGVGLGWNQVEYESLGQDFHTRGRRIEEQVRLMRELWTKPLVTFDGRWNRIPDAGLNPLPAQRPIPIWFGGTVNEALKRAARLGDGWMTNFRKPDDARPAIDLIHRYLDDFDRDPKEFGIEARILYGDGDPKTWEQTLQGWESLGVEVFSINTMSSGFTTAKEHLKALEKFSKEMGILKKVAKV
ncbi:MAG: LLM class F420-dependent oxidoreductase [Chloroflexi bacterium]|nr:MAG: LLM class F420-dependent oxidoreductase [Chloroflexota bacterium]